MQDSELPTDSVAAGTAEVSEDPFRPANDPAWTREAWYIEWKFLASGKIPE